jgi:release factor glutamine methyltransferase
MAQPTYAEAVDAARARLDLAQIDDARLEAELLLAHALATDREHIIASARETLGARDHAAYDALLARRLRHEPLAYITGHREFYGLNIACSAAALIPRPESELLVDVALQHIGEHATGIRIADVGTGTGAIACAIATRMPEVSVMAIDRSQEALALAAENAERLGVARRVLLRSADLLEGAGAFDIVVANLPYISDSAWRDLQPEVRDFEPREALVAGPRGTEAIERLISMAPDHLAPGALVALEFGDTQGVALLRLARACFPVARVSVMKDLAGLDRVLVIET